MNNVWLVTPCWRRPAVTRLALAQRAHLEAELAARGVTCQTVVVADDENLDVAAEFGCHVVQRPNILGAKVNAGFRYAWVNGASHIAFVGSDDWLHPRFFDPLVEGRVGGHDVLAGHIISIVDMETGLLRKLGVRGPQGVSPWLIPVRLLERCEYQPVPENATRGMEGHLHRSLLDGEWMFHDPHHLVRVDFKSATNMTPYQRVNKLLGFGEEEEAWPVLASQYPADLVEQARVLSEEMQAQWAGAVAA